MDIEKELRMLQALRDSSPLTVNEIDAAAEQIMSDYGGVMIRTCEVVKPLEFRLSSRGSTGNGYSNVKSTRDLAPGKPHVPSKIVCLMQGIPGLLVGLAFVSYAFGSSEASDEAQFSLMDLMFPYLGIVLTIVFCCVSYLYKRKAEKYEEAKQEYWHQRDLLVAQQSML